VIQATVVLHGNSVATNEAHARIVGRGAAELPGRPKLEIRSNDVDRPAQCDLSFSL
jgi:hypothetical protein